MSVLKKLVFVSVFALSACATLSRTADLETRIASWVGADTGELVAILGEPADVSDDLWTWRITGVGTADTHGVNSVYSSVDQPCGSCDPSSSAGTGGYRASAGRSMSTQGMSMPTAIETKDCSYIARVRRGVVVGLETAVLSGRCDFSELPARTPLLSDP